MAGQGPDDGAIKDPDAGAGGMDVPLLEDELGDVLAAPGEVIDVVDGVEIRHEVDERDVVLSVVDDEDQLIGGDSFPETGP